MELLDITMYGIPIFRKKLFIVNKYYLMQKEQREGELELISLAEVAKREDHWTYFHRDSFWVHIEGKHCEEYDPKTGGVRMFVETRYMDLQNQDAIKYLGNMATDYHIHVDEVVNYYFRCKPENAAGLKGYMKSLLIYPSRGDLMNSLKLDDRTHKIATSLGITTYRLKSAELFEKKDIEHMMLGCQPPIAGPYRPYGEWLEEYVNNVKEGLGNYAALDFCPKQKL